MAASDDERSTDPSSRSSRENPQPPNAFARLLSRLIAWQVERPWSVLGIALLLVIPSILLARGLGLRTGFESLLPENKASVQELKRVGARTAGVSTFIIVADGKDGVALRRFGDALLPKLRALGPEWVGTAENGVQAEQEFLRQRQALFLSYEKVKELHDRIEDRYDFEVHGSVTGDEPEPITRATIEKEFGTDKAPAGPPYPGGYYMNAEQTRLVTLIRTPVETGDLPRTKALEEKVRATIDEVNPKAFDPSITTSFTGDLVIGAEQYGVVKDDLATVGAAGILMILFVDWLFFLRVRAVVAMGLAIGIGVLWCFALTRLVIGHLNTASGFLVSIVFGNGINFGILLRARYNEARRDGLELREAVAAAYRDTWRPTLTAAAAAGAGYVSLATTNFRGFRDFGAIGGYGMLLCWIANYLFMVPILVLVERWRPTHRVSRPAGIRASIEAFIDHGVPFGKPFAWIAGRGSRLIAAVGILSGIGATVLTVQYLRSDPLEYELWKLENDEGAPSAASELAGEVTALTGRTGQDGMAIMVERVDQVKPLVAALQARRAAAPEGEKPFEKVVSIFDVVPDRQAEKLGLLKETRARIERVHALGKIADEDWKAIEPYLPPKDLEPFGIEDLPERVARPFTEKDGTRGRIVFIAPTDGASVRDVRYLRKWADAYRETILPSGEKIIGSGRAVIFADMIEGVIEESPKAIVLSFLGTAIVVALAFSRGRHGWRASVLVLGSLILGIAWMGGVFALLGIKINFLNFIAIPITFGIGVDYAINVVNRWRLDGPGSVVHTVRETGGAVILCSLTTTLGYLALLRSINRAVRSFGLAAVIGELTCLFAALVVLPAILVLLDRRAQRA
jgi:predicted RND superfamily exporter protein